MAKRFRVPLFIRVGDILTTLLLPGCHDGNEHAADVHGPSGVLDHADPIIDYDGGAVHPVAIRRDGLGLTIYVASSSATLTRRHKLKSSPRSRLSAEEAALDVRRGMTIALGVIRSYYSSISTRRSEAVVRDAARHPTFELVPQATG